MVVGKNSECKKSEFTEFIEKHVLFVRSNLISLTIVTVNLVLGLYLN